MLSVDPKPLVEVRCSNTIQFKSRLIKCNRKLGEFEELRGEIRCPKCKYLNKIEIKSPDNW